MKRETHFVVWSDGAITVIYRDKKDKGLSDYVESHTYTGEESKELADQFQKVVRG